MSVLHLHEGVKTGDKVDDVLVANEQGLGRLAVGWKLVVLAKTWSSGR